DGVELGVERLDAGDGRGHQLGGGHLAVAYQGGLVGGVESSQVIGHVAPPGCRCGRGSARPGRGRPPWAIVGAGRWRPTPHPALGPWRPTLRWWTTTSSDRAVPSLPWPPW